MRINYILMNSGRLYAYNSKGITIMYDNNKWKPSTLDCVAIVYSDRTDYEEIKELDVEEKYGKEVVEESKVAFRKISEFLSSNKR